MSYLVLARKYRPATFEEIVAQSHISRTLQNAIKYDRVASAYLFCGPRGTGKTTTARVLAKAINCDKGPTTTPCGQCPSCTEIATAANSSLDVFEIDAASNTGVDDIRTLREQVNYQASPGKKRIYIIDEVHRLSKNAFDALLKTLEEPPDHVIFIFATTEPLSIPETILSRTQRFDFKRVSVNDLTEHLKNVSSREKLVIGESALRLLARKAEGSVRDALSLLDQVSAFAAEDVTEEDVVKVLGLVDRKFLSGFTAAIASRDTKAAMKMARQVGESGIDIKDFATELLEHLRILLTLATDPDTADLFDFSPEELTEFTVQAENLSVGDIVRLMKTASQIIGDLKSGLNERLALEMAAVRMAEMESTVRLEDILSQLGQPQSQSSSGDSDLFGRTEKKKGDRLTLRAGRESTMADSSDSPAPPPRSVNLLQIRAGWEKFLTLLKDRNNMVASQLAMASLSRLKDNQLVLKFSASQATSKMLVEKDESTALIREVLREQYRCPLSVSFEIEGSDESDSTDPSGKAAKRIDVGKLIEESPRLRSLIDKVDGEIIGVKKID